MRPQRTPLNTASPSARRPAIRRKGESGVSVLEFALVAFPMILMMFGVVVIGVDLGRAIQVAQICRDADSMFSRGVPLYSTAAQSFLVQLGQNMNLQSSGGDGLIILSKIQFIPDPSCGTPTSSTYANCTVGTNRLVQRIQVGNTAITGSSTRFPTAGTVSYDSLDQVNNYTTDANAVISNFATSLQLKPLEESFVAEAYFQTTTVSLGLLQTSPGIYAQAFF
jgi:Flp pilus assembly protein TadG